jgi:Regulatory CLIP domain of proteinases
MIEIVIFSISGCSEDQQCISIKECPEVLNLARRVKNAKSVTKKRQFLSSIKSRVCDAERRFKVCCDVADVNADGGDESVEEVVEIELDEDVSPQPAETAKDPCTCKNGTR